MKPCTKIEQVRLFFFSCFSETDIFWVHAYMACGIVTVNHELFLGPLSFSVALVFFLHQHPCTVRHCVIERGSKTCCSPAASNRLEQQSERVQVYNCFN